MSSWEERLSPEQASAVQLALAKQAHAARGVSTGMTPRTPRPRSSQAFGTVLFFVPSWRGDDVGGDHHMMVDVGVGDQVVDGAVQGGGNGGRLVSGPGTGGLQSRGGLQARYPCGVGFAHVRADLFPGSGRRVVGDGSGSKAASSMPKTVPFRWA